MTKLLLKSLREYKRASWQTALFAGLEVLMEILLPFLTAKLIDQGIYGGDLATLGRLGLLMVLFVVLGLLFGLAAGTKAATASTGFARNLRRDLYVQIQGFSFANIDRFSTAGLVTRLTTDVTNVQNAYQMILRIAVRAPLMLVFSLVMCFAISAKLSLLFLVMIPILGGGLYWLVRKSHPLFTQVFRTYDVLNGVVQENLAGIRVVKSFVREDHERHKFQVISSRLYDRFHRAEGYMVLNTPLMQGVVYLCMILLSWFGARLIVLSGGSALTTGELTSLITYAMQILTALMMLSMVLVMITIAQSSGERIAQVLTEESDLHNPDQPVKTIPDGSITFDHVSFGYQKDAPCLRDLHFTIPAGATVGILGGTGSGKSSLVQLIPRLYDATEGTVSIGGQDVRTYDLDTLRQEVAMVLQKNTLFSGTIRDNLRWGDPNASDEALVRACRLAQADDFIRAFPDGYDTMLEQGGANLSGGQKQRLCIARALLKAPKILILDDSTSAVDTRTDARIRKAFREEIPHTTKLIIAQRISSIADADQIIVLDGGRVEAMGTHAELLASSQIYREVYASQQKGGTHP